MKKRKNAKSIFDFKLGGTIFDFPQVSSNYFRIRQNSMQHLKMSLHDQACRLLLFLCRETCFEGDFVGAIILQNFTQLSGCVVARVYQQCGSQSLQYFCSSFMNCFWKSSFGAYLWCALSFEYLIAVEMTLDGCNTVIRRYQNVIGKPRCTSRSWRV